MAAISELKDRIDTKTLHLVLLSIVTSGIYLMMWVFRYNQVIAEITKTKIVSNAYIIWMTVCLTWYGSFMSSLFFEATSSDDQVINAALAFLFLIPLAVLQVMWAFKVKAALENYALMQFRIDLRMNSFYTFLFHFFYINYCINDLPEAQRKHQVLMSNFQQGEKQNSNPSQQG